MDYNLILAVIAGIALLLFLILYFRLQAFLALLISSIAIGLIAGMPVKEIITTMQNGMGGTLGFVAVVVGLGAMFGAMLEYSGGARSLAQTLTKKFGESRASWALVLTGFFIAIPVFFDVAFIIIVPIIYAMQRASGKSLLYYAIPLLAGLAITHAFVPPTPGPVAVADILGVELGYVILFGLCAGIPSAILSGPVYGKFIANQIHITAPPEIESKQSNDILPSTSGILAIIALPIVLILLATFSSTIEAWPQSLESLRYIIELVGHPFVALIIANLVCWYVLGVKRGVDKKKLLKINTKSFETAGIIILLTGAGGVLKQMLVDTGAGEMLANTIYNSGMGVLLFAYLAAVLVRLLQGSATVAMITAAGLVAPIISNTDMSQGDKALLVIAIASGASILSHVNDSGFWLVKEYLGMDEKQTFRSWSIMTLIISLVGITTVMLLSLFV